MLINLSNHPIETWKPEQIEAALVYGNIEEITFPNIPPEYTVEEVQDLALQYLHKCEEMLRISEGESAIHITGEMSFCFILIQMLLKKGYTCLTATSKRDAKDGENGEKIVNFKFEQFREYKLI